MLEIGTSGLMSGEEKRVVILLLGDLIPRSFSTLPNSRGRDPRSKFELSKILGRPEMVTVVCGLIPPAGLFQL